jgi:hypothetical protein
MAYEIDIRELKEKLNAVLDCIVLQLKVEKLQIQAEEDFYWDFHDNEMFDVSLQSPELVNGRLSDDIEFLKKMGVVASLPPMLDHVAPILRYLAYKIPGYLDPEKS